MKISSSYTLNLMALVSCGMLLCCGCASIPKAISPSNGLLASKKAIGIIWIAYGQDPVAKMFRVGNQGLLDMAINKAGSINLTRRLNNEPLTPLVQNNYLDLFERAFKAEGFTVKRVDSPYVRKKLEKFKITNGKKSKDYFKFEFVSIAEKLNVDYLLILEVDAFGVARPYYSFIPTGNPRGYSKLSLSLVDGSSQRIEAIFPTKVTTEEVNGPWNTPPEYDGLVSAVHTAFEKGIDESYILIFGRAP